MGSVWLAEHTMLGRRAAIKVLHSSFSRDAAIVTRFFNEARAATAIDDPGIVQIFDFGQHVDGSAYIVMELLEGETARSPAVAVGPAQRPRRAPRHAAGRELARCSARSAGSCIAISSPRTSSSCAIPRSPAASAPRSSTSASRSSWATRAMKTQTSAVMGTPTYMSPEQCRGAGQVDQRSDVYALGCVLFALVVGRPPFQAEGIGDIIAMHLREPPPAPSMFAPGIPPEVDAIVASCLAKDPALRFASAADLAHAIGGAGRLHAARSDRLPGDVTGIARDAHDAVIGRWRHGDSASAAISPDADRDLGRDARCRGRRHRARAARLRRRPFPRGASGGPAGATGTGTGTGTGTAGTGTAGTGTGTHEVGSERGARGAHEGRARPVLGVVERTRRRAVPRRGRAGRRYQRLVGPSVRADVHRAAGEPNRGACLGRARWCERE